jgi:phage virion morphogenesis protein
MVRMDLTVDEVPLAAYQRALAEAAARGEDMTDLMEDIGDGFVNSIRARFAETSTAPDGTPWRPRKNDRDPGRRLLVKDGRLGKLFSVEASSHQVSVGTNVEYAGVHQFGASIARVSKKGKAYTIEIPARPFVGVSAEDEVMVEAYALQYIAAPFERGGGQ